MITVTDTQRDEAWFAARCGRVTASRFRHVIDRNKPTAAQTKEGKPGNPSAKRTEYLWQIVAERLTGNHQSVYETAAMRWGTEQEPAARAAYESEMCVKVVECGFVAHPTIHTGCSPDGLVESDGLIEIKAPWSLQVHLETWLNGMPEEHEAQIQGQLWLTGRHWCDFISWSPLVPSDLQMFVQRVHADPKFHEKLEQEIIAFSEEADSLVKRIQNKISF